MILITGASGFLGKSISNYLLSNNFKVLSIGRNIHNDIQCDLKFQMPLIIERNIDLVIHAAGKAHTVPKNFEQEQEFFNVNVNGTRNLLNALDLLAKPPKCFVFISSVAVYGKEYGININESEGLNAKDPYGVSKVHAENIIAEWCRKKNVLCTILRLPLLVGKNPPGNLGSMLKAIKKGYYFNIAGGTAKKSMVLIEDVGKFIPQIAEYGGIYNLTDGVHHDFASLSEVIAKKKIFNLNIFLAKMIGYLGDILGDIAPINSLKVKKITSELTFDDSKAREFGWAPSSVLEYFKKNEL